MLKDEVRKALKEIKREDEEKAQHDKVHRFIYQKLGRETPEGMMGMLCVIFVTKYSK